MAWGRERATSIVFSVKQAPTRVAKFGNEVNLSFALFVLHTYGLAHTSPSLLSSDLLEVIALAVSSYRRRTTQKDGPFPTHSGRSFETMFLHFCLSSGPRRRRSGVPKDRDFCRGYIISETMASTHYHPRLRFIYTTQSSE